MANPAAVFGLSLVSTLIGSMSGGSSSLLTTPTWIALGYPLPVAVGSDKVAGAFWTVVGARNYLKGQRVEWPLVGAMIGLGVIGASIGVRLTTRLDPAVVGRVVGLAIVTAVAIMWWRPTLGTSDRPPRLGVAVTAAAALPLGFYEGMFGSGNSMASTLLFASARGHGLLRALGHYYVIAAPWCAFAALAYWRAGFLAPALAVPATAGAVVGGYLGSRIGVVVGGRAVRVLFLIAGLVLGGKLVLAG